jgi:hypothetical protein
MKTIFTVRESDMIESLREVRFLRMNRHPCIIGKYTCFQLNIWIHYHVMILMTKNVTI